MLRHDACHRMTLHRLFQIMVNPGAFRTVEDRFRSWFAIRQRTVVEIGCVLHMAYIAFGIKFYIKHPLRDDATFAETGKTRILDGVFQIEKHARSAAGIVFVHKHGAALQKVALALKGKVYDRIEKRMTRADEGSQRLTLRRYQRPLKGDALIPRQHRFADTDQAVAVANRGGNVGDLIPARFALLSRAS